ncbi:MAG: transcription antitermination factor NusB [Hyphomicrobiales bacterium]|jgi:N utilization substance protein B|nr:transcription antitermination factor NusB [Hyphomicrobiales bacterium]
MEKRRAARLAAVQALYQMDLAGKGLIEAMGEFETFWMGQEVDGVSLPAAEANFFRDVLSGVVREQRSIDRAVDDALADGWPLKRIETVLRSILRAGTYELMFRKDVPAKAVINEYVTVASSFYEGDEPGMTNGVLDRIARTARAGELA